MCSSCFENTTKTCLPDSVAKCPLSNCLVANTATQQCLKCTDGFYVDAQSVCRPCSSNCRTCYSETSCHRCADRFFLQGANQNQFCAPSCASGTLPSLASFYYLNQSFLEFQLEFPVSTLFQNYTPVFDNSLSPKESSSVAVGFSWEPIFTKDLLWNYTGLTPYRQFAQKQIYLTLQCLPCRYYCAGKCAPSYVLLQDTDRCVRGPGCPVGYDSADQGVCAPTKAPNSVKIQPLTLRFDGAQNINQDLILRVASQQPLDPDTTTYNWTLLSTESLDPAATQYFLVGVPTNRKLLTVPSLNLRQNVTYTVQLTVTSRTQIYTDTIAVQVVFPRMIFSLEDLGVLVETTHVLPLVGESGVTVFSAQYVFSNVDYFADGGWTFSVSSPNLFAPIHSTNLADSLQFIVPPFQDVNIHINYIYI